MQTIEPTADAVVAPATDEVIGELPPTCIEDVDLSVDDIVLRAERADDYLRKWRSDSVGRRAQWEIEEAERLELEARKRGSFYLGAAIGVSALVLGSLGLLALSATWSPTVADVSPPQPARIEVAPVEAAPVRTAPAVAVVEEALAEEPAAEVEAVDVVPVVEAAVAVSGPALSGESQWVSGRYAWSEAVVQEAGVELAWFDGSGAEVLDRVACAGRVAGAYKCYKGRSGRRIDGAIAAGAQPGQWTVKACQGDACSPIGTLDAPL